MKQIAGLAAASVLLLTPSGASASAAKSCGDSKAHGITGVRATNVSCATAVKVARNYNVSEFNKRILNRWSCKGTRVSSTREKVTCRKGSRKITFRSTYQVELPPASAPPSANGGS